MCSLLPPFFGEMKLPVPEGLEELELRKLNNNEIQFFFFIHLKFSQDTNKDYLYNQFVIFLI